MTPNQRKPSPRCHQKRPWRQTITSQLLLLSCITIPTMMNGFIILPSTPTKTTPLRAAQSSSFSNPNEENNNLSSAAKARREYDRRRHLRRLENIPGKTSAIPSATDYTLNPTATEQLWLSQASNIEIEISRQTDVGMTMLKNLRLEAALEAFERVYSLKPEAYLWQAGIVQFYLNRLEVAKRTFEENARRYESKFGEPASEEKIWRDACELKMLSEMKKSSRERKERVERYREQMEGEERSGGQGDVVSRETRKVIRIARDLFSASVANDHSNVALSRAKLRSICGEYGSPPTRLDRKMWRLSSWYYLGLHYDALGEEEDSKACMKMALRQCFSTGNGSDIIHTLPVIHMSRRDWYDDEEFVEDLEERDSVLRSSSGIGALDDFERKEENTPSYKWSFSENKDDNGASDTTTKDDKDVDSSGGAERSNSLKLGMNGVNPIILESIQDSVDKMKLTELQDALRKKGLKTSGSKSLLQERLMYSLLEDEGLGGWQ